MDIHSFHPATGERLRSFPSLDEAGLRARIAQSAEAFESHRDSPMEHRALCLRKLAQIMAEDRSDLSKTIVLETGTPLRYASADVERCILLCREAADGATRFAAREPLGTGANEVQGGTYLQWSPLGPVLAVVPWRQPLWQPLRFAVPSILAGNTVLLKHAATVPQCSLALEGLLRRAGFSRGVFTSLMIGENLVETALNCEEVCGVALAGSPAEARALGAQAGWLLKRCAIRVGGVGAMIVLPSADLPAAARAAARSIAEADGSCGRIAVHSAVYAAFTAQLVALLEDLRVADPLKEDTETGPLGTSAALGTLEEQVAAAVAAGGRVLTGGSRMLGAGWFFEPTLLGDVPPAAAVVRDGLQGPAAMIFRAPDVEAAIALASNGRATTVSVWTHEPGEQQRLLAKMEAESVLLNAAPALGFEMAGSFSRPGGLHHPALRDVREFLRPTVVSLPR